MGVDETRLRADGPNCPSSAAAGAAGRAGGGALGGDEGTDRTIEFLRGDWAVERLIRDRRAGQDGAFRGIARFQQTADSHVLEYTEDGELRFGSHHGPARRSLIYRGRGDGAADVRFADGGEFYRLDLSTGAWQANHPCRADRYHVTVTRLGPDSFTEVWQVAGPEKDYELDTTYRRIPDGPIAEGPISKAQSGIDPAGCEATMTIRPDEPR
ncbi:MAG TPA: DUF6314 family protein [Streptosporangiaceae bacterium]|nr:DUF6314 family protein [Streptosporangiaceae bacterium]